VYHVELRQFPHNHSRFNLDERELQAVVTPWVLEQPLEFGERKWIPVQAKITILEGPRLAVQQLAMGRGWRNAQRASDDVTERVLTAARDAAVTGAVARVPGPGVAAGSAPLDPLALSVQLATLLGRDPAGLLAVWRAVAARHPELAPSEALAASEREIASAGGDAG
jgi:hypothetical protein